VAAADVVPAIYTIYAAVIAAGGVAVGAIVSSVSDRGKDKRAERREKATDERAVARERLTRREETSWKWYESRATYERDTALQLQQEIHAFARAFVRLRHADEMNFRSNGTWGRIRVPEDIDEEFRAQTSAIQLLRVRLFDAELREQVSEYVGLCTRSVMAHSDEQTTAQQARRNANDLERQSLSIFDAINEQLGAIIRKAFESLDPYQVPELPQFSANLKLPSSEQHPKDGPSLPPPS